MPLLAQLVLLSVLWSGARAALTLADISAAPEVKCMASFVSSILPPFNSCIIAHGDGQLVGPLLQELAKDRQMLVLDPRAIPGHTLVQIHSTKTLYLFAAVNATNLSVLTPNGKDRLCSYSAIVFWTKAQSLADALRDPADPTMTLWMCSTNLYLAISTPNHTTIMYGPNIGENCFVKWSDLKMREIGRCKLGRRGWQGQQWQRICSTWKSPEMADTTARFLSFIPYHSDPHRVGASTVLFEPYNQFSSSLTTVVSRQTQTSIKLSWERNVSILNGFVTNCSLAAAVLSYALDVRSSAEIQLDALFMVPVTVVVPAGAGLRLDPLRAVTAEFSAELWIATALALLFMTAAIAVAWTTVGRPPVAALAAASLQTLAPLLAQSPPGRTAHRPLSAVWLLMSVVIAAAYQGLLLRELTSAPPEINTLEQLEQSGLDVYAEEGLHFLETFMTRLNHSLKMRIQYFNPSHYYITALRKVVDGGSSALICRQNMIFALALSHVSSRVHVFTLPNSTSLMASVIYSKGSPFGKSIHSTLGRFDASALLNHHRSVADFHITLRAAKEDTTSGLIQPLSLGQVQPAFVLLAVGFVFSAVVFVLEVLFHKWAHRHAPPVPVFLH
ncbi:Ionotropic receptor 114 [Frankliniella occidentalis]|nr:Ionotropic receptor 114 [Frankliniella occidentalis]